eukprot:jgi/Mesen1/2008/ME000147S01092
MAQSQEAKIKHSDDVPGLMVKVAPLTPEDISEPEKIGGKWTEKHEIEGKPITPEDAAEIVSAEQKAGHDTSKGSLAARMQAAADVNVKEGIVPPVGTASMGTERGVLTEKEDKVRSKIRTQHGSKETASHAIGP